MDVEIREAYEKDCSGIYSLISHELGYPHVDFEALSLRMKRMKDARIYHTFVALLDNQIVGFIGAVEGIAFEIDEDYFRIIGLAVSKLHQNKGIGSLLLNHIENFAISKGISTFTLSSGLERIEAHQFYEHNGYIKRSYSFKKK